jgi:hypothetical protein
LLAQSSQQITILGFDPGELTVDFFKRKMRNWNVPTTLIKLFSDVGFLEKLRAVPRIHFIDRVSNFGVIKIGELGLRYHPFSELRVP